jgi:hypothetical protein
MHWPFQERVLGTQSQFLASLFHSWDCVYE